MLNEIQIPGFEFREAEHKYFIDGVRMPSVTQILTETKIIDTRWYDEQSAIRGSQVHKACLYLNQNDLDFDSLNDTIRPYVYGYQKFLTESGFMPMLTEQQIYNKTFSYCGTLDMTGILNDCLCLIDIKSGSIPRWAGLQTGGYLDALKSMGADVPVKRYALALKNDATYSLKELDDRNDINVFRAAVALWRWQEAK